MTEYNNVKMIDPYEQAKARAEGIINTILYAANNFEQCFCVKPTVFMSYDIFALVAAGTRDLLKARIDRDKTPHTICGYDLELIHQGSELLYIGYRVGLPL